MKKFNKTTMSGNVYPFYLGNSDLGSNYYLYQLTHPGIVENNTLTVSMAKVGERVSDRQYHATEKSMWSSDLISTILRSRKNIKEEATNYLQDLLHRDVFEREDQEFPWIDAGESMNTTFRLLVTSLRDAIRWKLYSFSPGNKIDVLLGKKHFVVFNIIDAGEKCIKLVPQSMYEVSDVNLTNPTPVPDNIDLCNKVWGGDRRASDINRDIRKFEWDSLG